MIDLLSRCSINPTIDELLQSIVDSDSKLKSLAKELIGKSSARIILHEDNWLITDRDNKERLTGGLYDPNTHSIHLSK